MRWMLSVFICSVHPLNGLCCVLCTGFVLGKKDQQTNCRNPIYQSQFIKYTMGTNALLCFSS